jgi:hypothetical protein
MDIRLADSKRVLSVKEFCNAYSVSAAKFYLMLAAGEITARKNGTRTVIDKTEAERWFNSLPVFTGRHTVAA